MNKLANPSRIDSLRVASFAGGGSDLMRAAGIPVACLAILLTFGFVEPRILTTANLGNIAVQASYLAIFALAQTVVILTRGFDLSLGYSISLVSVLGSMTIVNAGGDFGIALGIVAGVAVALAIGLANGLLVAGVGINPLVTTLGMANIVMALSSTVSDGFPVTGLPQSFMSTWSGSSVLGVPVPVVVAGVLLVAIAFTLRTTQFGRSLYIVGANPRAATAAGIRTVPVIAGAYCLCGFLIGIGALLLTARTGSGEPTLGGNLTLESIAAAVVGGVKLSGGEGGVGAALMGALLVTILSNGMNLMQVDGYLQQICLGVIIIVSLIISRDRNARS